MTVSCGVEPVISLGLEPKTYCLEGSCSIQLSYETSKSAAKLLLFIGISKFLWSFLRQR